MGHSWQVITHLPSIAHRTIVAGNPWQGIRQAISKRMAEGNELHADICQALADPTRILILYALHERPRNVMELAAAYEIPEPTVSRYLKVLRERGLVITERRGSAVVYSLRDSRVIEALNIIAAVWLIC